MRLGQILAAGLLIAGLTVSLCASGGYAAYLRSAAYRESCAAILSERLGLPSEISRVIPRARDARDFAGIRVWLPERRGIAASCERATLAYRPTAGDADAYTLELVGGGLELSTRTWLRSDYRSVLESGLRPGFAPDGPSRVAFRNMHVALDAEILRATLHDASGQVDFVAENEGHATVVCYTLNDHQSARPFTLRTDFSPTNGGVRLDRVELTVPEIPIAALHIAELLGIQLESGAFSGRMTYSELDGVELLRASGGLTGIRIEELTSAILPTPWRGHAAELQLDELIVRQRRLEKIRFHGWLDDVRLGDVLSTWGLGAAGGTARINIRTAELSPNGIDRLVLTATCDTVALEPVSRAIGWGAITGTVRVAVSDLTVVNNQLTTLNAEIRRIAPPDAAPDTIDSSVLVEAVRRALQITLPPLLPQQIEYSDLGVRLEARDELLNVFGTHGPGGKIILTARLAGQDVPLIPEPMQPIDLRPQLDLLRAQIAARLAPPWPPLNAIDPWVTWFRERWPIELTPAAATQPGGR